MVVVQQEGQERSILTVAEINTEIQNALAAAFPAVIWVRGEVQRFPHDASRRKHVYFELHDTSGGGAANFQVSAAIMDWDRRRFGLQRFLDGSDPDLQIQDQLELCFACKVDFYPPFGKVSLKVVGVDKTFALGQLEARRRAVLAYLSQEQLLERNALLSLPDLPLTIGLITAAGSAAENDFRSSLRATDYPFQIDLVDCRMQGEQSQAQIVQALAVLARRGVDLIVLTRGGGSRADLSWFDLQDLAVAIATCPVPVITGIGHEIDRSIADEVAHTTCKTPTAAAEFLVDRVDVVAERLARASQRLVQLGSLRLDTAAAQLLIARRLADQAARRILAQRLRLQTRLSRFGDLVSAEVGGARTALVRQGTQLAVVTRARLSAVRTAATRRPRRLALAAGRCRQGPTARLELLLPRLQPTRLLRSWRRLEGELKRDQNRLRQTTHGSIQNRAERLEYLTTRARLLDPQRLLARGFTLTFSADGRRVRGAAGLKVGDRLRTRFCDGEIESIVQAGGAARADATQERKKPARKKQSRTKQVRKKKGKRSDGEETDTGQETLFR